MHALSKRCGAEFFGTFWLVLGGCAAVLAAGVPDVGIGYAGVALAFGLTVLTMASPWAISQAGISTLR